MQCMYLVLCKYINRVLYGIFLTHRPWTHAFACMYLCIYVYTHAYMWSPTHIFLCVHGHICMCTNVYICTFNVKKIKV